MQPTPNGRMHIGHASGAYLRADVIARHLRRDGHEVSIVTGSDAYEDWILVDALRSGRTLGETCWRFHHLIGEDLRSLDIGLDQWISPLDEDHTEDYRRVHEDLLRDLIATGSATKVSDPTPRSATSRRYVTGYALLGVCPQCHSPGGGNACEECGYHYQPAEILQPRSRFDDGPLEWVPFDTWYLRPRSIEDVVEAVRAADVAPDYAEIAIRYLRQTGGSVRLSQPGSWGMASDLAGDGGVLSNTYYGYSLYCAKIDRRRHGAEVNAFHRDSDVITVGLIGIDNAIGGVAASHAIAIAHGRLKAFDHMVTNYFLEFEGEKCSTSRRHGIWVHEILGRTSVTADELRYHLSHSALEGAADNFLAAEFIASVNRLRSWLAVLDVGDADRLDGTDVERIRAVVNEQGKHLHPGAAVSLPAAVAVLDEWLASGCGAHDHDAGWRTGLALLAEPFMPGLAGWLWAGLGRPGRPNLAAIAAGTGGRTAPARPHPVAGPLTADELGRVTHFGEPA